MNKRMSKFGSGILETLNPPSSDVYWVYVKSIDPKLVLGLNGGCIIRGRIIPSNTVSYDKQVKVPV